MTETLTMSRGDSRILKLAVTDKDDAAVSLAGVYLWWTAKRHLFDDDSLAIIRKTTNGGGITVTNEPEGLADVALTPADTKDLLNCKGGCVFFWDLQGRDVDNSIITLDRGTLIVTADVTRSYVP